MKNVRTFEDFLNEGKYDVNPSEVAEDAIDELGKKTSRDELDDYSAGYAYNIYHVDDDELPHSFYDDVASEYEKFGGRIR